MKNRFNSYDIVCMTAELQRLVGLRVNQVYDIDNKTYLIKLQEKDTKHTLLMESGIRFHTTSFEWPKNPSPSGFTMKLRKHLKNKRLEALSQVGNDRIIKFQFGIGEATYYLVLELYDRGNIVLCDWQMTILNVLRPHTEGEAVRFAVREKYPENRGKSFGDKRTIDVVHDAIRNVKSDDTLKRLLTPILDCGPTVLTHILTKYNLIDCKIRKTVENEPENAATTEEAPKAAVSTQKGNKKKGGGGDAKKAQKNDNPSGRYFDDNKDMRTLIDAINEADVFVKNNTKSRGYIIQKAEMKPAADGGEPEEFLYNIEYHPYLFDQFSSFRHKEFDTFDASVDEFYSTMISQKIDMKAFNQECEALKKLSNVKKDHEKRLEDLSKQQHLNRQKAELITRNQDLVNSIVMTIRGAIANQMSWADVSEFVKQAQSSEDNVASCIKQLKLETNHISLLLKDPYAESEESGNDEGVDSDRLPPTIVDIDLALTAYANATRYYDQKRSAAQKEHRTIESSTKAFKNAERRTQEHLKEVRTISNISKARKTFWFEKFYWFISSENYLVIGGRDQQQNELIVKRYLRSNDIYVHADIQGASSIVIRNQHVTNADGTPATPPPKTLLEAGAMAISYSVAWDAKVTTSAYWVRADQVSKTAPSGEYLGTGSFMIRGKKNFLPPCHLILGLSVMFKLEDDSVARHANDRCVRTFDNGVEPSTPTTVDDEDDEKMVDIDVESDGEAEPSKEATDASGIIEFPDTQVSVNVGGSSTSRVRFSSQISTEMGSLSIKEDDRASDDEEGAIIHGAAQHSMSKTRIIQKARGKENKKKKQEKGNKKANQKRNKNANQDEDEDDDDDDAGAKQQSNAMKRGQRSKFQKIKKKYKDQDEEEKMMRMDILKSAGRKREDSERADDNGDDDESTSMTAEEKAKMLEEKRLALERKQAENAALELDDDDGVPDPAENEMLNTLTGCPVEEDEILFALPVVAPYNALHNYKYKVKLTPGTARRGKTAKTALTMFLKEKTCTRHEKDLLKAIKHDLAARNMPGKVKLSAPQKLRV